ncbi:MAG TPA: sigma factor [Tepidisphaeraceae bacterium]|nr:sigma factor [Tepidisphaeraceae bacterium]
MLPNPTDRLAAVEGLILEAARSITRDHHEQDDVAQQLRAHVATKVIPAFDESRGAKWSTFAACCIRRASIDILRARQRAARYTTDRLGDLLAPDDTHDERIERLADEVRQNPEQFFNGLDPAAVLAVLDPGAAGTENVSPSMLHCTRCRMRRRVRNLAVQLFA